MNNLLARAAMEAYLERSLNSSELVHHKDEDPTNNDINNLEVVSRSQHKTIHNLRGHVISEEGRERIRQGQYYRVFSKEARKRMGHPGNKHRLGKLHTQEAKDLMSRTRIRRWKENKNAEKTKRELLDMSTK